ncbi:peptide-N4-(N-acetyl-beta-glucosaminyl)asparagine amidase, partial [Phenoliferia sp. Uapishka_3]
MSANAISLAEAIIHQLGPQTGAPLTPEREVTLTYQAIQLAKALEGWGKPVPRSEGGKDTQGMLRRITNLDRDMDKYEDPALLDFTISLLPLQELYDSADLLLQQSSPTSPQQSLTHTDALVTSLCTWFKASFFKWVDPILHPLPPHDALEPAGSGTLTDSEIAGGAGRVELWRSPRDGRVVRFPRYNDPRKVLEERKGRCGEWANAFCACLRALGVRARYIFNTEDHVWCEYFSEAESAEKGRWVHVDPCEASTDAPLTYALGWGKNMRYCLAFSTSGCTDVTARYVPSITTLLRPNSSGIYRDLISESDLSSALIEATRRRRQFLSPEERSALETEDARERDELSTEKEAERLEKAEKMGLGRKERTSGTMEWRKVRGEATGGKERARPVLGSKIVSPFSSNSVALQLNGASILSPSNTLTLTSHASSQTSSAFFPLPSTLANIILDFKFRITLPPNGGDGADGMAFVVHSDPRGSKAIGGGGSDLGYAGIKGGWAVEIDCYRRWASKSPTSTV